MRVYDSRIVRPDSFLVMDGVADFREFGTDKFMEDVIISSDEKTIIWEGWDITKTDDEQEFSMRKGLGKNFKVGYKRQMDDETHYDPVKNQDEFQLEYDVDDINGTVEIRAKENEEFVVLKKKYKF